MKLIEFQNAFPTEEACRLHFKIKREEKGILCKKCGGKKHYWLEAKWQWQCSVCHFRTTLRSGTAMQHSHLSFRKWFLCLHYMFCMSKGMSAKEMQRQLGHKRYRTIWFLMHRIRRALGRKMILEYHDYLFTKNTLKAENIEVGPERIKSSKMRLKLRFTHLNYVPTLKKGVFLPNSSKWISATHLGRKFYQDACMIIPFDPDSKSVSEFNILSNFYKKIIGVHHRVSFVYLQYYMDEYSFKYNAYRRNQETFREGVFAFLCEGFWYGSDHSSKWFDFNFPP